MAMYCVGNLKENENVHTSLLQTVPSWQLIWFLWRLLGRRAFSVFMVCLESRSCDFSIRVSWSFFLKNKERFLHTSIWHYILRAYRLFELSPHGRHSGFSKVNPNPWAWWYPLCHPETAVDQVDGPEGFCDSDVMTHEQLFNKPPNTLVCRGTVWKGSITLAVILRENVPHLNYQSHQQWR